MTDLIQQLTGPEAAPVPVHVWDGDSYRERTYGDFSIGAHVAARGLQKRGLAKGQAVGCVLSNSAEVCAAVLGVWLAGGVIVSLPIPARGLSLQDYADQLGSLCKLSGTSMLLVEQRFIDLLEPWLDRIAAVPIAYEALASGDRCHEPDPLRPDELALIQFSSGSTASPKGCMLTLGAIAKQVAMLKQALCLERGRDVGSIWLPLSHDMGLIGGLLLSWSAGMVGMLSTPERFLVSPRSWFDDCASLGATMTVGTSSALAAATRAGRTSPPGHFPMRACVIGAERVEWSVLEQAVSVLGPYGLTWESLVPAYGLAEATLAVAQKPPGETPRARCVDAQALFEGEVLEAEHGAASTTVTSVGPPLDGVEVGTGAKGRLGELLIRTPSVASGYLHDPVLSEETFTDRGLRTHDLGFADEDGVFIVGRSDDVLSVGGRNVHACDIEAKLSLVPGVRPGNCVLISVDLDQSAQLVLMLEAHENVSAFGELAHRLSEDVARIAGLRVHECLFVPRGKLPKTPSGKIQRYRCRAIAATGQIDLTARVPISKMRLG